MPRTDRRIFVALAIVVGTVSVAALKWTPPDAVGSANDEIREIVLVARQMSFQVEGDPGALNPTLRLRAGSRVRIVLRNEERGITHSFTIPAWDVDTGTFDAPGTGRVEFRVPLANGPLDYVCTPHAKMMRGTIVVQ